MISDKASYYDKLRYLIYHNTNLDQVSCWHLLMCRCQPLCHSWWFNTRFFLVHQTHQTIKCWCQLCTYITCLLLLPQMFLIDISPLLSLHLTWVSQFPDENDWKRPWILVWSTLNLLGLAIFPLRQETFRSCSNWVWEPQIWGNSQVAPEQFIYFVSPDGFISGRQVCSTLRTYVFGM